MVLREFLLKNMKHLHDSHQLSSLPSKIPNLNVQHQPLACIIWALSYGECDSLTSFNNKLKLQIFTIHPIVEQDKFSNAYHILLSLNQVREQIIKHAYSLFLCLCSYAPVSKVRASLILDQVEGLEAANNNQAFNITCQSGNLLMLKLLLTIPAVCEQLADFDCLGFRLAIQNNHDHLFQELLKQNTILEYLGNVTNSSSNIMSKPACAFNKTYRKFFNFCPPVLQNAIRRNQLWLNAFNIGFDKKIYNINIITELIEIPNKMSVAFNIACSYNMSKIINLILIKLNKDNENSTAELLEQCYPYIKYVFDSGFSDSIHKIVEFLYEHQTTDKFMNLVPALFQNINYPEGLALAVKNQLIIKNHLFDSGYFANDMASIVIGGNLNILAHYFKAYQNHLDKNHTQLYQLTLLAFIMGKIDVIIYFYNLIAVRKHIYNFNYKPIENEMSINYLGDCTATSIKYLDYKKPMTLLGYQALFISISLDHFSAVELLLSNYIAFDQVSFNNIVNLALSKHNLAIIDCILKELGKRNLIPLEREDLLLLVSCQSVMSNPLLIALRRVQLRSQFGHLALELACFNYNIPAIYMILALEPKHQIIYNLYFSNRLKPNSLKTYKHILALASICINKDFLTMFASYESKQIISDTQDFFLQLSSNYDALFNSDNRKLIDNFKLDSPNHFFLWFIIFCHHKINDWSCALLSPKEILISKKQLDHADLFNIEKNVNFDYCLKKGFDSSLSLSLSTFTLPPSPALSRNSRLLTIFSSQQAYTSPNTSSNHLKLTKS